MANVLDIKISKKRTTGRHTNRANPQVSSIEDYYRVTVFVPFIDDFFNQFNIRFINSYS